MNRRKEILLGSLIIVLILAFFGFKILDLSFDRDGVLEKIDEAIASEDVDYLRDHIEIRGIDRDLSDGEIKNIAQELGDISVYSLSDQKDDPDANINIQKQGREKLIFDKYIIVLKPYDLTISPNKKGTKVLIDGEEVGEFEEDEEFTYEKLLPGRHEVGLSYKNKYADIQVEDEVLALNRDGDNEIYLSLTADGRYIYVESNLEEASLFVDGKDTEINIYDQYKFGPIDENKKIKIHAQAKIDGEDYQSEKVEVSKSSSDYYSLDIDYEEPLSEDDIREDIDRLIEGYETALVDAINSGYYGYLDGYIEYGSPFMEAQKKLVANLNEKGVSEDLLSYKIESFKVLDDGLISVVVSESHMIYYESGDKKQVNNKWNYTASNKDGSLMIRDIKEAK